MEYWYVCLAYLLSGRLAPTAATPRPTRQGTRERQQDHNLLAGPRMRGPHARTHSSCRSGWIAFLGFCFAPRATGGLGIPPTVYSFLQDSTSRNPTMVQYSSRVPESRHQGDIPAVEHDEGVPRRGGPRVREGRRESVPQELCVLSECARGLAPPLPESGRDGPHFPKKSYSIVFR